jgi:YaiO family outer membrane protein
MKTAKSLPIVCALMLQLTAMAAWSQDLPDKEALAQQAIAAHRFAEARDLYIWLTENHPKNISYWTARGRVCGYLADYPAALTAYDKALSMAPEDVDILVGKAYILLWEKDYPAATLLLNKAHGLAPESAEVELAMAQESYYQNHRKEALNRLRPILLRDPEDKTALELKSHLRPERQIRVELGTVGDTLSIGPSRINGVSGVVDVGLVSPGNFISVHYEDWLRFGNEVVRGGINFSHTFSRRWTVDASTLIGSRGDVLARYDNSLGLKRRFNSGWAVSTSYRDLLFDQAHIRLVSPGIEYSFEKPISLQAIYSRGWSTYSSLIPLGEPTNSIALRYTEGISKCTIHAGWSRGIELYTFAFAGPLADQLGQFSANTYSAGIDVPVSKVMKTRFDYAFQRRSSGANEQTVSARLIFQR